MLPVLSRFIQKAVTNCLYQYRSLLFASNIVCIVLTADSWSRFVESAHAMLTYCAAILTSDSTTHVACGFCEATQRLLCNYASAVLTQFDGRAHGDDVMARLKIHGQGSKMLPTFAICYRAVGTVAIFCYVQV